MSKRLVSALLAASLAAGTAAARPPDLPVDTKEICVPGVAQEESAAPPTCPACVAPGDFEAARRMYLIGERCRKAGDLDMARNCYEESYRICPVGAYADRATWRLEQVKAARAARDQSDIAEEQEAKEQPATSAPRPASGLIRECDDDVRRLGETRKMYFFGEYCRRSGDVEMAYRCYKEAHQICPSCSYGRKALTRMQQIDADRRGAGAAEEQEPTERELEREWRRFWYQDSPRHIPATPESKADARRRVLAARQLFRAAEAKRRAGDLDRAYQLYQQTHLQHPDCWFGRKAIERLTAIEQERYLGTVPASEEEELAPYTGEVSACDATRPVCLLPVLPAIDLEIVQALDRLLTETAEPPASIRLVMEERSAAGEEEAEAPVWPCRGAMPPEGPVSLFVEPPVRDLIVREARSGGGQPEAPACHDLSDWFVRAVRMMQGAGSLRIEAGRLGHLLSRGEVAVRDLGCALVHEGGRCYIVYPAPGGSR